MNDYDKRQYLLLIDLIRRFRKRSIRADHFIYDIEGLLNCLQEPDPMWKKQFHHEWAKLEDIYAFASSEGERQLNPSEQDRFELAVNKMEQLLKQLEIDVTSES